MSSSQSPKAGISKQPVWWLRPHMLLAGLLLPIYILIALLPISPRYGKYYLSIEYVALGAAFLVIMTATAYVASTLRVGCVGQREYDLPPWFMDIAALVTIAAYILWFWRLALNPDWLIGVISGRAMHIRSEVTTIPGLTTLSQFGFVYSTLWALRRWVWQRHMPVRLTGYLWIIILLTVLRTVAWGERLATIEVLLPLVVVFVLRRQPTKRLGKICLALAPFLLIVLMFAFFGTTELFRSWGKQQGAADSVWSYMWDRFTYYYFSALNNGCGLLQEYPWPQWDMQFTLNWVYEIPGLGQWFSSYVHPTDAATQFLLYQADSEFTTYSGMFSVVYDGGILFGFAVAGLLGTAMGLLYHRCIAGCEWGLMLYPLLYLHLLETLRLFYLGESRTIPIWIGFALASWVGGMARRRRTGPT